MTRNRKVDPELLEREYIYDTANPPVSFTQLAERHGLARNTVAEKATKGRWFERRQEFRRQIGEKAVEALGEQWVRFETATREKLMSLGLEYMGKYAEKLTAGEIPITTRDMLGIAAMMRTLMGDTAAAKTNGEEVALYDPSTTDLDPDEARRILAAIESGSNGDGEAEAAGAEEPGED